jgi:hypothetical protein
MYMRIIMNMNIYITPSNEKLLRDYALDENHQGNTMSGLINRLLVEYFGTPGENRGDAKIYVSKTGKRLSVASLPPKEPVASIPSVFVKNKSEPTAQREASPKACKHGMHPELCKHAPPGGACK